MRRVLSSGLNSNLRMPRSPPELLAVDTMQLEGNKQMFEDATMHDIHMHAINIAHCCTLVQALIAFVH